ncbi:5'-3' exonuclease [Staphylococcus simulans]|uniref:5'-3' exonuclease n=1 Tax=Staphylococcus simulans TaxID=1286 RepID=UPI00290012CC|nr:5'-3' exonuclease [Staphylococcus simulans]MDU0419678.1 5'-3' exonuclease [Staphylococcus simulans]MDU0466793.1 5'-3' exonuclease [Staphylococcus simulans]
MTNKVLLVDGMALLFRHFYATSIHHQFMRNSNGVPTNGVQGFVRHIFSAIDDIQPTHIAVCWDMGQQTFRNEMFADYKQHRPAPPDELIPQFDLVQDISNALGFVNIGVKNYEADDVIGTLSRNLSEDNEVYIVTGDKDILQCINPNVEVWLTKKGFNIYNRYNLTRYQEEYQLHPLQLIDIKAFMGDTADGYPGVKGIGGKTAHKLILKYQSVENVINHIDELTPAQQKKIISQLDDLKLSKQLAEIHTNVPLDVTALFNQMQYHLDFIDIFNVLDTHDLKVSKKFIEREFLPF